jgi:hypothetical protein
LQEAEQAYKRNLPELANRADARWVDYCCAPPHCGLAYLFVIAVWSAKRQNRGMKTPPQFGIVILIICIGFLQDARAVTPPPDGGYPGFNTAEGQRALSGLTSGEFNTGIGFLSLFSNSTGNFNTALGAGTLLLTTVDGNTAIGAGALLNNTIGFSNTANGAFALFSNTIGLTNSANGYQALFNNTTGSKNTAVGTAALLSNTTGVENTATGLGALATNSTGVDNTATGLNALGVSTGSGNTAVGANALGFSSTGHGNTALGDGAGSNVTTASNVICVGTNGANADNSCFIGNIFGATSSNGAAVLINSSGQLGTMTSSKRFKEDIQPIDKASEALFSLNPVKFRYKKEVDPAGTPQLGLVAEEVEKINSALVVRDEEGKPYSVRYDQVNAMLLNEFLKEHREVQKLEATLAQQREDFEAAVSELKGQIQKVSAQLEVTKPAPQTVMNNQ